MSSAFGAMQPTWRVSASGSEVLITIANREPIRLQWPEFADLANCCKQLSEDGYLDLVKIGEVAVQIKKG